MLQPIFVGRKYRLWNSFNKPVKV